MSSNLSKISPIEFIIIISVGLVMGVYVICSGAFVIEKFYNWFNPLVNFMVALPATITYGQAMTLILFGIVTKAAFNCTRPLQKVESYFNVITEDGVDWGQYFYSWITIVVRPWIILLLGLILHQFV